MKTQNNTDSWTQRAKWGLPDGKGLGGLGERGDRIKAHQVAVTKYSREVKYSTGSTGNAIVTATCGVRWGLDPSGGPLVRYRHVEPPCRAAGADIKRYRTSTGMET